MTPRGAPPRRVAWTRACGRYRPATTRPHLFRIAPPCAAGRSGARSRTHSCTAATQELPHDVFPDRLRMALQPARSSACAAAPMRTAPATSRCSARRSARTCAGPSSASASRDALVVPHQGYRATYDELWEKVETAARAFIAHGVDKGDRIAIWAPNRYEWVVTQFAAARIGAILVAIDPACTPAELGYALSKAGVSVLVMARGFRSANYAAMLADVRAELPTRCARRSCSRRTGRSSWPTRATPATASWPSARRASSSTIRSRSSSPRARRARPRARRSRTTTSSTTPTSRPGTWPTANSTACACRFRSRIGSAWSSASSPAPRTARASWCRARRSTRRPCSRRSSASAAPRSTACPRCSSTCSSTRISSASTCPACARA